MATNHSIQTPAATRLNDISGKRFGRWVVLSRAANRKSCGRFALTYWACQCDCGVVKEVRAASLMRGKSTSCGCRRDEMYKSMISHGDTGSPEYKVWQNMLNRCRNPNLPNYKDYGGRGIYVCERWSNSFDTFVSDMGRRPSESHSIDRIDVEGPYSPQNCRWATPIEQSHNKRKTGRLDQFTTEELIAEITKRLPVDQVLSASRDVS